MVILVCSQFHRPPIQRKNRLPPLPSYQNIKSSNGKVPPPQHLRVQSPNRNDFKDFSTSSGVGGTREFRSPIKQLNTRSTPTKHVPENGKLVIQMLLHQP